MAAVGARPISFACRIWGITVDQALSVPSSVSAITETIRDLLMIIEQWPSGAKTLTAFCCSTTARHPVRPTNRALWQMLPLDQDWLKPTAAATLGRPLSAHCVDGSGQSVFSTRCSSTSLLLYIRPWPLPLAAENASRLAAMQSAEGNIRDRFRRPHQPVSPTAPEAPLPPNFWMWSPALEALTGK